MKILINSLFQEHCQPRPAPPPPRSTWTPHKKVKKTSIAKRQMLLRLPFAVVLANVPQRPAQSRKSRK